MQTTILPDPVPTSFTMTQLGAGFGSLDPDTGAFRFDVSVNTKLGSPEPVFAGFIGENCVLGPTSLTLTSDAPFDLATAVPTAHVSDVGFSFPAARGCGDNGSMDQVLNPALELPTTATRADMTLALIQGAPGVPSPTTLPAGTTLPTTTTTLPATTTASSTSLPTSMPTSSSTVVPAGTAGTTVETAHAPGGPPPGSAAPLRSPVAGGRAPAADAVRATPAYTG